MLQMFKSRDIQPPPEAEEETIIVGRSAAVIEISDLQFQRYKAKADDLSFEPAALRREELMRYLKQNGIGVYNYDNVSSFLDAEFGRPPEISFWKQTWGWRPFTIEDAEHSDLEDWGQRKGCLNGEAELPNCYQGKVPFEVLELISDMREALPFVHFFVSDAPTRKEREMVVDPFLAASWFGLEEMIVVAQWDEPKFFGQAEVPE